MPRPLRVEYEGARYHVMCRGNRGATVFGTEEDVCLFLKTLSEAVQRADLVVHAYALMSTHYHLLLETPGGNLVEGMKWLQGAFTQRMNAMHRTWGHLFQGRYKAKVIETDDPEYFRRVADYIHLNPAEAGLVGKRSGQPLAGYGWSSFPYYVNVPRRRPDWLTVDEVLRHHQLTDSISGRRQYRDCLEGRARQVASDPKAYLESEENRGMERGWVHGSKEFRRQMVDVLESCGRDVAPVYDGRQKRDLTEQAVERVIAAGCSFLGIEPSDLPSLKKSDRIKVLLAACIKEYYPMNNQRISELLNMGHPTFISRCRALALEHDAELYKELCTHLNVELERC